MKFINWFINRYATPSLLVGAIGCSLAAVILLLSVLFNFKPYLSFDSGRGVIGFRDYRSGIPVKVSFDNPFPDTIIHHQTVHGSGQINIFNTDRDRLSAMLPSENIISADTILASYEVTDHTGKPIKHFSVKSFTFSEATAFIQTPNFWYKFLFFFPSIVLLLVISYISWQAGLLLDYIQTGKIFELANYKRLQNIGIAIISFELICLTLGLLIRLSGHAWNLYIHFTSHIPKFISPLNIWAEPDYDFEWLWFLAGCIIIVIAKAFQKGYKLQQEQDLTI